MLVGISVGLVGFGSVVAVPLLIYGAALTVHGSICVAMLTMTLIGTLGTLQSITTGRIEWRAAALVASSGAVAAPAGAWLNKQLSPTVLLVLFAIVVLAISARVLIRREPADCDTNTLQEAFQQQTVRMVGSIAAGIVIGLLGGLLGISGGFIAVPVLAASHRLELSRAVTASWMIVMVVSAVATLGHFLAGERVPVGDTLVFVIGAIAGFEAAVRLRRLLSPNQLRRIYAVAVSIMSAAILMKLTVG
jgi:uncharacterized membrane protein YfcA